jgi:hypothetical protein
MAKQTEQKKHYLSAYLQRPEVIQHLAKYHMKRTELDIYGKRIVSIFTTMRDRTLRLEREAERACSGLNSRSYDDHRWNVMSDRLFYLQERRAELESIINTLKVRIDYTMKLDVSQEQKKLILEKMAKKTMDEYSRTQGAVDE